MIALVDYGSGNIRSAHKALVAAGGQDVEVTADPDAVARASRIVLPGVGAFADCMAGLQRVDGLLEALEQRVRGDGVDFLGICVGMQLMADKGHEFGVSAGLGWISGITSRLEPGDRAQGEQALKVPHMGWNEAVPREDDALFQRAWGGRANDVYFVHSFALRAADVADVAAWCSYGGEMFAAAVSRDNLTGVQFHPEKSQRAGLALLEAWVNA
jgi:imidazole glycerol-phosphate synthase subunit HisH